MKKIDLETLKTIAVSVPLKPALENEAPFGKVSKFITLFKIKEGKNKITAALIYKVYKDWSPNPVSKMGFFAEFSKLFISELLKNRRTVYMLNYKPGGLVKKGQELRDMREIKVDKT